ncbi:hypothetical protein Hanom_Chr05g00401781 [Helianthus anomalus]
MRKRGEKEALLRIDEMEEEYESAVSSKRWDKKRECYVNREGEPVVPKKDIVYDVVLLVIPRTGEFYSKREKDKNYEKNLNKIIRHAMTSSLRNRDEQKMKKNINEMMSNLKKVAEEAKVEAEKEEVKVEAVEVEDVKIEEEEVVKEAVAEEHQVEEAEKKEEKEEV